MPICRTRTAACRPHRRGRGDRAAGCGDQGTGRERARRRRVPRRDRDRGRRAPPHPRRRRRARHGRSRSHAFGRAARDLENPRRRLDRHHDLRLPRRGAAVDRLGVTARNPHQGRRRADGAPPSRRGRDEERNRALRPAARHKGRGARPLRRHARPAQVLEIRSSRGAGGSRHRQAAGAEPSGGPLFLHQRHRFGLRLGGLRAGRGRPRRAAAPGAGQ